MITWLRYSLVQALVPVWEGQVYKNMTGFCSSLKPEGQAPVLDWFLLLTTLFSLHTHSSICLWKVTSSRPQLMTFSFSVFYVLEGDFGLRGRPKERGLTFIHYSSFIHAVSPCFKSVLKDYKITAFPRLTYLCCVSKCSHFEVIYWVYWKSQQMIPGPVKYQAWEYRDTCCWFII